MEGSPERKVVQSTSTVLNLQRFSGEFCWEVDPVQSGRRLVGMEVSILAFVRIECPKSINITKIKEQVGEIAIESPGRIGCVQSVNDGVKVSNQDGAIPAGESRKQVFLPEDVLLLIVDHPRRSIHIEELELV